MVAIQNLIKRYTYFLGTTFVLILVASCILLFSEKTTIHLEINAHHSAFADFFFRNITFVGDGLFAVIGVVVIGIIGYRRYNWVPLTLGLSTLMISGAIAQFLKQYVYPNAMRPVAFLSDHKLYLVEGVQIHLGNSFPSGHTTAAFAFFGFISGYYLKDRPILQVLCALCAGLIGYSRMYLSQHFLEDVFTGMLIGTLSGFLMLLLASKKLPR